MIGERIRYGSPLDIGRSYAPRSRPDSAYKCRSSNSQRIATRFQGGRDQGHRDGNHLAQACRKQQAGSPASRLGRDVYEFKQALNNDPTSFVYAPSKVYSTGDVTIDENDKFNIDLTLSGFGDKHGLYHMLFVLTRDFLIDNYEPLPDLRVPEELESTTVRVRVTDAEIKVNHPTFQNNDAVVLIVTNKGAQFHQLVIYRLNDGHAIEELAASLQASQMFNDSATVYGIALPEADGEPISVGMVNIETGTYVIAGIGARDSLTGLYDSFTLS